MKEQLLVFSFILVSWGIFIIPLCGLVFSCECTWVWSGAIKACNVHDPEPPNCPWCAHGITIGLPSTAVILLSQLFLGITTLRLTNRVILSSLVGILTLVPAGYLLGWMTELIYSY